MTEREADDLVRDADRFLGLVEESLGLTRHHPSRLPVAPAGPTGGLSGRPVRPPPRGLGLLPAVRRLPAPGPGGAGRRARDGHPGADRPRRHLRRGPVRQGLPAGRHPAGARRRPRDGPDRRGARALGRPGRAGHGCPGPRCAAARSGTGGCPGSRSSRRAGRAGPRCAGWSPPPTWPGSAATRSAPSTWSPSTPPARDVLVLLGPASEVGAATTAAPRRPRPGGAPAVAGAVRPRRPRWSRWSTTGCPGEGRAPPVTPPGWPGWPRATGTGAVLSNAVRYADRADAVVVDVLDAARRLVPLDLRHVDRGNAEGFLKSGKEMADVAEEVCRAGRARGAGGPASCWRTPGWSPTGARSTRGPTSGWGRCTSPSWR